MKYVKVTWIHNLDNEPVLYYHELDDQRLERRKVVEYADGNWDKASESSFSADTYLSPEPLPTIEEINEDNQFIAQEITKDEFERKWNNLD
ncbi:hypothetical protein MUY27_03765 [Mucilaginibacter sp. RS28]|uniref:DUF6881 domain-containing protein n=1 Tax=Mucilaginibacter straminoryzae TaxID=2932774 RepID=A0A9X1X2J2_9SPHI|nr:hypothetical protein [Mucilaginibacter straminoryzae]MCJ8208810.1 hypothetical protein [Mucilaginibacter straminoryzae]